MSPLQRAGALVRARPPGPLVLPSLRRAAYEERRAAANGQLDTGAHTATLTALGRLMHTLTADDIW